MAGRPRPPTPDVATGGQPIVEIECRAPTHDGAANLAADLVEALQAAGHMGEILNEADAPDSGSGQRGNWYARELTLALAC